MTSHRSKWSKQDIRNARHADLPSLLQREGLPMREKGGGNFELLDHPGLIVKSSYWRWPAEDRQGNTIDLLVDVLGKSFAQAMRIICGS